MQRFSSELPNCLYRPNYKEKFCGKVALIQKSHTTGKFFTLKNDCTDIWISLKTWRFESSKF